MPSTLRIWLQRISRHPLIQMAFLAAVVGIVLVSLPPLTLLSYDLSHILARPTPQITNAVLVYVNAATLDEDHLGNDHGELSRTNHARLLERLAQEKAKLVFYDFIFSETNDVAEVDQTLERAIKKQGSVILMTGFDSWNEQGIHIENFLKPIEPFMLAASGWGHSVLFGNVVREISADFKTLPSAAWVAAKQLHPEKFSSENPNLTRWLNYYGSPNSKAIPYCYFHDALTNVAPPGFFTGKIVFVGQNFPVGKAGSFKDSFATPYSLFNFEPMPGVEIHATALLNLVRDDWLRLAPLPWQWLTASVWGVASVLGLHWLSRKSKRMPIFAAILGAALVCAVSLYVQWHLHWWWGWFGPAFAQTAFALVLVRRIPKTDPYIAFISYRAEDDGAAALLIARYLSERGHKTFIDVRSLTSGRFDEQLVREIESATFFILILSPNSLARCVQENDWVLRELTHALANQKKIIPIFKGGFNFKTAQGIPDLPEIKKLETYHGLEFSNRDFDGFMERLVKLLQLSR